MDHDNKLMKELFKLNKTYTGVLQSIENSITDKYLPCISYSEDWALETYADCCLKLL